MRYFKRFLILAALCFSGCSYLGGLAPTPTPTPGEIARQAGARMLSTNSLYFLIEISGDLVYLDTMNSPPTIALKRAEGEMVRPDQVQAVVQVSTFGFISEIGIIGLGEAQYATNPFNQQWERLEAGQGWYFDPTLLFDPVNGIEAILEETDWTLLGSEEVQGQSCYVLYGRLQGERISPLTSGLVGAGAVETSVWVDQQDATVRRIRIVELESDPQEPTNWLIEFSDFDRPVEIVAPPIP